MTTSLGRMKSVAAFSASNVLEGLRTRTGNNDSLVVEGMAVFKSGTFKDSMGMQATWEPEHIEQMVFNFNMLRDRGTLPNVPVREDHRSLFGGGGKVIGYVLSLKHDQESGRLLADFEFTEPDAAAKFKRGTYRARSAEIGMYETNDEALYWPVFMGFAFVDIPAVEGLYNKAQADGGKSEFIIMTQEEAPVADDQNPTGAPATPGTPPAAPAAPEAPPAPAPTAPAEPTPGESATPATPAPGTTEHSAPAAGAFQFSINGAPTTDFAAVQRHITALETAQSEAVEASRKGFITQLAKDRKITQPQVEGLQGLVATMNDEQFAAFSAAYTVAPTQPLLDVQAGTGGASEPLSSAESDEMTTLRETLAMHTRAGVPQDQLEKMPSFIRLKALEASNPKE